MQFFHILDLVIQSLVNAAARSTVGLLKAVLIVLGASGAIAVAIAAGFGLSGIGGVGLWVKNRKRRD